VGLDRGPLSLVRIIDIPSETSVLTRAIRRYIPEYGFFRKTVTSENRDQDFQAYRDVKFMQEPHGVTTQKTPFFMRIDFFFPF
jgi:hypothetical protein